MKIYKKGESVYEVVDDEIKEHIIEDVRFLTWIQLLKIDGKWQEAKKYHETLQHAMEVSEGRTFMMYR